MDKLGMKNEDYVRPYVARTLKDKGFKEECDSLFDEWDKPSKGFNRNNRIPYNYYSRPTLAQAAKWLRDVGVDIDIDTIVIRAVEENVYPRIIKREYKCKIIFDSDEVLLPKHFFTYEAALAAGIEKVIDRGLYKSIDGRTGGW